MPFFRYQKINKKTLQNLVRNQNWLSDPLVYNDPFEFKLQDGSHFDGKNITYLSQEENEIKDFIWENISKYGVICYSTEDSNILLWSHYADNHKGMCLVFDVPKPISKGFYEVKYTKSFPKINLNATKEDLGPEIIKVVTTKAEVWSYEKEYRQILLMKNCFTDYPGEIVEVIFGCRTPFEDIQSVVEIIQPKFPDIIVSKMVMQKNTYSLSKYSVPNNGSKITLPDSWKDLEED